MQNECGSAIEELLNRRADARLRSEINTILKDASERLTQLYYQYAATPSHSIDLRELRQEAFDAMRAGSRLLAAEQLLRKLSQDEADRV